MTSLKSTVFLLLAALGFTACAPRPVFRLKSLADQSTWYQGTEYIHSHADSIFVTVAYIRHSGGHVIFDVEVANYSDHVVQVDPAEFSYKAFKSMAQKKLVAAGYAVSPEAKLLQIDKEIAEEKAEQKTMLLFAVIGATAMIAEEATDSEEDNPRDEMAEAGAAYSLGAATASGIESSQHEISYLQSRRAYWTTETLRKTDLFPGGVIRGKVYFPTVEKAGVYNIKIPVGRTIYIFRFRQQKFKP